MKTYVIGLDLGGTNLPCAVMDTERNLIARHSVPTGAKDGPDAVLQRMADCVETVLEKASLSKEEILGLGVGAPGPLDGRTGVVLEAPNMGWYDVPVVQILTEKTGLKTVLDNDANCAGWGEYWAGAGRGCSSMIMMTLGTGVGGAVIIDGTLLRGPDWTAGEIGHTVIVDGGRPTARGVSGCLEAYASATAVVERLRDELRMGWTSSLTDDETLSCAAIFDAAKAGDELARQIVDETGRYLGVAAANMANLLNPERCIFSGGMIKAGDILFDSIRAECKRVAFSAPAKRMEILPSALNDDAGLIGAAGIALEALRT